VSSRSIARHAALGLLLAAAVSCRTPEVPYADEIAAWHADKDRYLREAKDSPIPADRRAAFPGLKYFPIDPAYRVPAALSVAPSDDVMQMRTSTGPLRQMRRVGTLSFTLKNQPLTLTAFVEASEADMRRLFVPFGDLTNGTESYQGGRYLDLDRTATGIYDLDFNRAYHPFCLYNPTYECPIPPRENRLKMPIRSGERLSDTH
jgi:uncharacterized protein (DUF1684 family)